MEKEGEGNVEGEGRYVWRVEDGVFWRVEDGDGISVKVLDQSSRSRFNQTGGGRSGGGGGDGASVCLGLKGW